MNKDGAFAASDRWVVNVSELTPAGAKFIDLPSGVDRLDFSGLPHNRFEQLVRKPKVARYRAALQAVRAACGMPIISHLPRMTAAVSMAQLLTRRRSPHLAFSFNFTALPNGIARAYLRRAFQSVDQFFVFSDYERDLYPRYFGLPQTRFTRLLWAQDRPEVSTGPSPYPPNSYVCAVGGEGRDYASLMAAAELLPDIPFVVIARPYNKMGNLPRNVSLLTNVAPELTWRIALESSCMIVPLIDETTCCGHITLVSAELLGIPLISSVSQATREYTEDVALYQPGDVRSLAGLIRDHHDQSSRYKLERAAAIPSKIAKYGRSQWSREVWNALLPYFKPVAV